MTELFQTDHARLVGEQISTAGQSAANAALGVDFAAVLDRLGHGIVLCGANLVILYANLAAKRVFEEDDGVRRQHNRLWLGARQARDQLARAARPIGTQGELLPLTITAERLSGRMPYTLSLAPICGGERAPAPRRVLMVMISDPAARAIDLAPERLAQAFTLTPAEARIASLACGAHPLDAIAERAGVSTNTVKTHLKSIYGKIGARCQAELVRVLMLRLPVVYLPPVLDAASDVSTSGR